MAVPEGTSHKERPDLSFVMPCYNEEAIVAYTVTKLAQAFELAGHKLELVVVDNGSVDRTGEILQELQTAHEGVVFHRVDVNEGYGNGILEGMRLCTGSWVGIIPADGQVDAEDVVKLYEAVIVSDGNVVGKVRRRFRMDGLTRKIVSVSYNLFVRLLWPRLQSVDLNGSPKLLPRNALAAMELQSKGWLLDPEIMIKAHYMGLRVLELNVFARMRGNGLSHVRASACWEFLFNLIRFRFSPNMARWKRFRSSSSLHIDKSRCASD